MTTGNVLADSLKPVLAAVAVGWVLQFGYWQDTGDAGDRFAVVQAIGGAAATLVRTPIVSVRFVGAVGDAAAVPSRVAEAFCAALIDGAPAGVSYAASTEPLTIPTADGRPVAEVVVSSIVSL